MRAEDDRSPATPAATSDPGGPSATDDERILTEQDLRSILERWEELQLRFLEQPREAVTQADELVAEVTRSIATSFARERERLERRWERGEDVSTEELRVVFQRYRGFLTRLTRL